MFQSYTAYYLGYDDKFGLNRYEYRIVDDDFVVGGFACSPVIAAEIVVIEEYSKRNLPVAANLFRCMCFTSKKYAYSMQEIIAWNVQHNKHYKQFEEEINKLLLLL